MTWLQSGNSRMLAAKIVLLAHMAETNQIICLDISWNFTSKHMKKTMHVEACSFKKSYYKLILKYKLYVQPR